MTRKTERGSDRIRPPRFAGALYPADASLLREAIARCLDAVSGPSEPALGLLVPHGSLAETGDLAALAYGRTDIPPTVVLLGPSHAHRGDPVALLSHGSLTIPGASIPVDERLAQAILARSREATDSVRAHEHESVIEVQLPFLVARRPDVRVVPIVLRELSLLGCQELAQALVSAIATERRDRSALLVASSVIEHPLPSDLPRVVERLVALDFKGLQDEVHARGIHMDGLVPATVLLAATHARGATRGEVLGRAVRRNRKSSRRLHDLVLAVRANG